MNATDTTVNNAPAATRLSAHAECDHPKTKTARAACRRARRAQWVEVTRIDVDKGDEVRVTVTGDEFEGEDMLEGVLLGWGSKRLVVRVDDERITLATSDVIKVEARA
jgi:type II secretory pathway component PulM